MRRSKPKKPVPFSRRLIVPMLCVALFQCVIFMGGIFGAGTLSQLRDNAYQELQNTLDSRWATLYNRMTRAWSNEERFAFLQKSCQKDLKENGGAISTETAEALRQLLKSTTVTGAYVIYDQPKNNKYPCLYLCGDKESVSLLPVGENDILTLFGDSTLVSEASLSKDEGWTSRIELSKNDKNSDFFFSTRSAALLNPGTKPQRLALWSPFFTVPGTSRTVLTYTLPLLDENGSFYGVIGVEATSHLIDSLLPSGELLSSGNGSYLLGRSRPGSYQINNMYVSGSFFSEKAENAYLEFSSTALYENVYRWEDEDSGQPLLIPVHFMSLYPENSVHADDTWILAAAAPENEIMQNVNQLRTSLMVAFVAAMLVGLAGAFVTAAVFGRPIRKLTLHLRQADPEKTLTLPKLGIQEIDELSSSISMLSAEVMHSASRLSQILAASNVPLGAIEYDDKAGRVFCTENIPRLLFFAPEKQNCLRYTSEEFESCMSAFLTHTRPYRTSDNEEDPPGYTTLQYTDDHGVSNWLSFQVLYRDDKRITVVQDISDTIREKIKLEYERDYDALTNLLNRRSFKKKVRDLLSSPKLEHGAMVMWDMDNLKYINDTYGHDTGDKYLAEAARLFGTLSGFRGVVGRMSGDEFFAFLHGYHSREELYYTISRLHNRLRQTFFIPPDGNPIAVRASGGIAWYPEDGVQYDELTRHADFAMYNVKNTRRGELLEFNAGAFERDAVLLNGKEALNRFVEQRQVRFAFQPIVDASTGEVFAYEALMRPQCRELPTVLDVMRLARAQSKLYQIELLTWTGVMETFASQRQAFGDARVFINSIPNMVLSENDTARLEEQYPALLSKLVIEIIESEQSDAECMAAKHAFAKKWGAFIALDDFGAGYSTESSLLYIAPDFVKIDMSIVHGLDTDENRRMLVSNILSYTQPRGMKVIAEGVETAEELRVLIELGVDYLQGYYLAKPSFELPVLTPAQKAELTALQRQAAGQPSPALSFSDKNTAGEGGADAPSL
ncbi:MAG: EAL domain-containing protein [Oscillospiraceae bacterium]|nr:EAL domain-containing protein [Oscillospiraceae bacterium]